MDELVRLLRDDGYTVIAPTVVDDVIMLRPVTAAQQIARGLRDQQEPGRYRLEKGDPDLYFEHVVGPDSPKRYFFPPEQKLVSLRIEGDRFVTEGGPAPPKLAFIGVRPCEVAAIRIQDRVFGLDPAPGSFPCEADAYYCEARRQALLVAVNCTRPGGACFCGSWDTGPAVSDGYDLAMTELKGGFVVSAGSDRGADLVERLPARAPSPAELELETLKLNVAREHMGRHLETDGLKELLDASVDHPVWDDVADRCLACTNCTMVCPTCFCSTVSDSNDLATGEVTRTRMWESCFTDEFSYAGGESVRSSIRAKYRQWMRHKLDTWWDQFDTSGCVGCGRCITWCPVGIDLTEESAKIRANPPAAAESGVAR
ncbi:MAG: sulfite reductase subunit A [Phycisphaeraceae bacterium]|nr:sulfite reductase subunit A [Phycisphaeraceae bacterium]